MDVARPIAIAGKPRFYRDAGLARFDAVTNPQAGLTPDLQSLE